MAPTVVWPAVPIGVPPTVVVPSAPATVFIERDEPAAPPPVQQQQQSSGQWWYYCPGTNAFYPYVRECAGGWQRVSPIPPS